ncbi:MAG: LysR family transcriptional regulator [Rhodobacteraceae bacterium]|nr:LysR family transcriptional regulator [Paracoccaceae bacterium]
MQNFDWSLLQSFLAVAEEGSYSAAARAMQHSQPTIGRHVQQLQEQLGAVLFQRSQGGYVLTQTGTALMQHAQAMRAAAARISLVAEGQAEEIAGTVRITASEIVATYTLPELLGQLLRQQPELQVELVATNSTENLLLREADIAVRMVMPQQQDLIVRRMGEVAVGLFAAQSYLDHAGAPKSIEGIWHHTVLGYDRSDIIMRGMAELGFKVRREDFAFRIDNQVAYLEALIAGVGIGATQVALAQARGLVPVLPEIPIPPLPVWLTAHQELRTSARVRLVFDFLAARLPVCLQ